MERNVRCNTGRLATNLIASRVNEDDIKSYEIFINSSLCLCLVSDAYHYRHAEHPSRRSSHGAVHCLSVSISLNHLKVKLSSLNKSC